MTERKTIKVPAPVFDKLNEHRQEQDLSWATYLSTISGPVATEDQKEEQLDELRDELEKREEERKEELMKEMEERYDLE